MPEPKAQLVDPQGPIDVPGISATGIVTATGGFIGAVQGAATGFAATTYNISAGVVTSTGFVGDVTGTASSVTKGTDLYVGVMTASSFSGDVFGNAAGLSTTTAGLKLGIVTSTTFAGDFTGMGSGITGTPNIQAGIMTATSFVGDFTGLASGITGTPNLMVGILTGTAYSGDGSALTGIAATNWITNNVTANSSTTTVDLSDGNVVKFTQSADTTVSFANTGTSNIVTFVRIKDSNSTARTLTWPSSINWDAGAAPTLVTDNGGSDVNVITLLTRDEGVTWYGWETVSKDSEPGVFIWGGNAGGKLGQNNTTQYSSPVQIPGTGWNKLDAGSNHAMATKTDGTLWAWGYGSNGQLAQNNRTDYSSPIQIPGTTWAQSSSVAGVLAIKTDGTLWAWGYNWNGNLGINANTNASRSSPVQIPGTTWRNVVIGNDMAIATKTDGTLWNWGLNEFGGCGQNNSTGEGYSSPVQIPGTTWSTEIGAGSAQFCAAIKTNGTLWMWGRNDRGQLGQNNQTQYSSPTQIPGTTWSKVIGSASGGGVEGWYGAIKTDGSLWMWGSNNEGGAIGQNEASVRYSSPVQVPGNWSSMTGSWINVAATNTDGELWVWGNNGAGMLGQNSSTLHWMGISSPVQVPGTGWTGVDGGGTPSGIGFIGFKDI